MNDYDYLMWRALFGSNCCYQAIALIFPVTGLESAGLSRWISALQLPHSFGALRLLRAGSSRGFCGRVSLRASLSA